MVAVSKAVRASPVSDAPAMVAVPACNEADRILRCLAALASQRDTEGAPIAAGRFGILIFANNCSDATVAVCRNLAATIPHPIWVVEESLPPHHANAGWARKRAMDLAADILIEAGHHDGLILTTDADSVVASTWFAATLRWVANGADGVAGYVDALPDELLRLGPDFLQRGRLEDTYLRLVAELYGLCDPRPHDPWPNHRVSSGASLAVRLAAYLAIGGLPPLALGEDAALSRALEAAGFKVRHAMDVVVTTSCRFDSRARGGAGDTMRLRHADPDAPCDDDMEPIFSIARRALWRGRLRGLQTRHELKADPIWSERLRVTWSAREEALSHLGRSGFEAFWQVIQAASPVMRLRPPLKPSQLPREIIRAQALLAALRRGASRPSAAPADNLHRRDASATEAA